jgi:uncharacterized protein with FMN-binding domain
LRRVILAICATAAALVAILSFKSHTQVPVGAAAAPVGTTPAADAAPANATPTAQPSATPSTTGTGTASPAAAAKAGGAAKTVTGAAWPTIYGDVQVKITVQNGKITQATAIEYPEETPRDYQINSYAIPQLDSEAVAANSAKIDTVSGATYTSGGYIGSLQSAVNQAGL